MKKFFQNVLDRIDTILKSGGKKPSYADMVVINSLGQFLILKRANSDDFENNKWCLPGGHIEQNERPELAAVRETGEETNLNIDPFSISPLKVKDLPEGGKIYYFACSVEGEGNEVVLDIEEHDGYQWIYPEDIPNFDFIFDLGETLKEFFGISDIILESPSFSLEGEIENAIVVLNKAFDEDAIDEDVYFKRLNDIQTIKKAYNAKQEIRTGIDDEGQEGRYIVGISKGEGDLEVLDIGEHLANDLRQESLNFGEAAFLYEGRLYDKNGIGLPIDPKQIKKQAKSDNVFNADVIDVKTNSSLPALDERRAAFLNAWPTIKKYDEYFFKYQNNLSNIYSSEQNNFRKRRKNINQFLTFPEGDDKVRDISYSLGMVKSELKDHIDPLFIVSFDDGKSQSGYLSELVRFINKNPEQARRISKLKIKGLEYYGPDEFKIVPFNPADLSNITEVHNQVLKRFEVNKKISESISKSFDKGEINEDTFLHFISIIEKGEIEESEIDQLIKSNGANVIDGSRGGKLVKKKIIDKSGRKQTKWVSKEEASSTKENQYSQEELVSFAQKSSLADLERTIKESADPELRVAAHNEIKRREEEEHIQEETSSKKEKELKQEEENAPNEDKENTSLSIETILTNLREKYKAVVGEIMNDDFEDEKKTKDLIKQQSLLSYYSSKLKTKFNPTLVNKENEIKKAISKFGFKSESEIKKFFGDGKILGLSVQGNNIQAVTEDMYCSRTIDKKNNRVIADEFILNPLLEKGTGIGTKIFSNQIKQFKNQGFKEIKTLASKTGDLNGYYTWARLGYNFANEMDRETLLDTVEGHENKDIASVKSLPELMSFKEGRDFWKENGWSFEGKFDLSDDSPSMFILNNYVKENGR